MFYDQCTLNIALFAKLKCPPMCIMAHFARLIVHQIYCVYGTMLVWNGLCRYYCIAQNSGNNTEYDVLIFTYLPHSV